jgi:hypothetical protein
LIVTALESFNCGSVTSLLSSWRHVSYLILVLQHYIVSSIIWFLIEGIPVALLSLWLATLLLFVCLWKTTITPISTTLTIISHLTIEHKHDPDIWLPTGMYIALRYTINIHVYITWYIHVYWLCKWLLYTCMLMVYMGAIYMYVDGVYGCY